MEDVTNPQPSDEPTDELSRLRAKVARIMEGLEGCCMTCEPVGWRNQQMEHEIATLKAERDRAREMYCNAMTDHCEEHEAKQIAKEQGWDCFKEDTK